MLILSWWVIIAILLGVGLVSGLLLGFLGDSLGLSPSLRTIGMGVIVGLAAAVLITRRQAAINEQKN